MEITFKLKGKNLFIGIKGDIDHHSAEEIRDKIDKQIARGNVKNIILDFSEVTFMDSSGIGMVIGRYKLIDKTGGQVVLCSLSPSIARIFTISGLGKILKTFDSIEVAEKAISMEDAK